jgi:hypothetical protein
VSEQRARQRNREIRSERSDADAGAVVRFLGWLVLGTVAVVILMRALFTSLAALEESRQPPPPVMKAEERQPPAPRLQTRPADELSEYLKRERGVLSSYAWVDRSAGVVRIPIEDAMRLVAERGLPVRQGAASGPAISKPVFRGTAEGSRAPEGAP